MGHGASPGWIHSRTESRRRSWISCKKFPSCTIRCCVLGVNRKRCVFLLCSGCVCVCLCVYVCLRARNVCRSTVFAMHEIEICAEIYVIQHEILLAYFICAKGIKYWNFREMTTENRQNGKIISFLCVHPPECRPSANRIYRFCFEFPGKMGATLSFPSTRSTSSTTHSNGPGFFHLLEMILINYKQLGRWLFDSMTAKRFQLTVGLE